MPHEKTRSSLLSDTLDRRRALTLSPGFRRDSYQSQAEIPYKIPRRSSTNDEDTEVSKDRKKSHCKIHWTQLASNGTSQSEHRSHTMSDQKHTTWKDIYRRQVRVVLEDVLQTDIGQSWLRGREYNVQLKNQSEHSRADRERQSHQTSTCELKDSRRTSGTQRSRTDCSEDTSPSQIRTQSTQTESCSYKKTKNQRVKQLNSSMNLSESSEVLTHSCSPRESDSPKCTEISDPLSKQANPSIYKDQEASSLEECQQIEEADSAGSKCEHRPSSSSVAESGGEHLANKRELEECYEVAAKDADVDVGEDEVAGEDGVTGKDEVAEREQQKEKHKRRNGEVVQKLEGLRGSVLRLSVGADGEVPIKRCRLDSHSDEQVPSPDSVSASAEGPSSQPLLTETIVLSSEEEEEEKEEMKERDDKESVLNIQPPEGVKDIHTLESPARVYEETKTPECVSPITELYTQSCSMMQLQLSSVHMSGVTAASNENMKITTETITILLKESSVQILIEMKNVCKYSVWEGTAVKGCELVKDDETTPPSLLLLWLSDDEACRLHKDLSEIQPGTHPAESGTCVVLCLAEPVVGIESAILASLMDMVALCQGRPELLSPLTYSDSLKLLQNSQETHLLQLLTPTSDAQTSAAANATVSAVKSQDVEQKPVYTLCHKRTRGSYVVSMAPAPGPEWTPYRHCGPTHRLIQFPPPPSKGALTVTTEDLECLDSGEFLNDVIIDFYLKYLLVQKAPQASVERSHIFSSFFYKQLTRRDNANEDCTSMPAQVRRHQRVRTWTRHVDIFDKDFLFVPVNQEAHWYLVVICFPALDEPQYVGRETQVDGGEGGCKSQAESETQPDNGSNSDGDKDTDDSHIKLNKSPDPPNCTEKTCKRQTVCKRPCILIMDSLKLSVHERIFKVLREYLEVEWEVKRGGHRDFSVEHMVGSHCKVPLQDNSSDCGLYLLQYAESFLQDPVIHFDLPLRLERWFPRQQVRGKRDEIRDLILHLYRFQQGSLGHEALIDRRDDGNLIQ